MNIYNNVFPLGLGTNRFPIGSLPKEEAIEDAVKMVLRGLDFGLNYIDTANNYSSGNAPEVLKRAFQRTDRSYFITTKIVSSLKTADKVRISVENHLQSMGISRADFCMLWSIFTYAEFKECAKPGGVYDGMRKLQDEGIIDHIVFSTHAGPEDIVKIMETQLFEGVTISYNLTNAMNMQSVLDVAVRNNIGVVAMNPLAGGIIPQNRDYFSYACNANETNAVQSALRYVAAQPAINIVLAGPSTVAELEESLAAFSLENMEADRERIIRVNTNMRSLKEFCTGCKYCEPCPQGIPISSIMQSRNALLFDSADSYNQLDKSVLKNIALFKHLIQDFRFMPETSDNPCMRCGKCEAKCTQRLKICESLDDVYKRMRISNYPKANRKKRLASLLRDKGYRKVGFFPGGNVYSGAVISQYKEFFGEPEFEIIMFNSSPYIYGTVINGSFIYSPDKVMEICPDCILIDSYRYGDEIYENLSPLQEKGIVVVKLHESSDVPWVF